MTIYGDLIESLETTPRMPRDAVSVALAKQYAAALDDCFADLAGVAKECPRCRTHFEPEDAEEDAAAHARKVLEITRLGGRLEAMLDRLGMAPGSRPALPTNGGADGGDPASAALDALRADSAAGAPTTGLDYAASVDPAVTAADSED